MNNAAEMLRPRDVWEIIVRRWWWIVLPFCAAMVAGIGYTYITPKAYTAETLILVKPQSTPDNYVESQINETLKARINTISEQIKSRSSLEKLSTDLKFFSGPEHSEMFVEDKIQRLRDRIGIQLTRSARGIETNAFSLSFKGRDPEKVMLAANALADAFIEENLKARESEVQEASEFLNNELEKLRVRLEDVEENIKSYRREHMGEMPDQLDTNLSMLENLQEQMLDRQAALRDAQARLVTLQTRPAVGGVHGPAATAGSPALDPNSLAGLKQQLTTLLSKYTERHPDVIQVKKRIAELEATTAAGGDADSAETAAVTPAAAQAMSELDQARREVTNIKAEIANYRQQIQEYERRIEITPKREQELLALRRDYDNIQTEYNTLLAQKLDADKVLEREKEQKNAMFKIIDRAQLPEKPIEPDMQKLFLLFVVAGLGIGGGIVFVLEYFDSSIRNPEEIDGYFELPVMAMIPSVVKGRDTFKRGVQALLTAASVGVAVSLFVAFALLSFKEQYAVQMLNEHVLPLMKQLHILQ